MTNMVIRCDVRVRHLPGPDGPATRFVVAMTDLVASRVATGLMDLMNGKHRTLAVLGHVQLHISCGSRCYVAGQVLMPRRPAEYRVYLDQDAICMASAMCQAFACREESVDHLDIDLDNDDRIACDICFRSERRDR